MAELNALSETDASNTSISAANVAEGCAPSSINDAIRNLAGMAKRAFDRDHAGSWCTVGGTANAITLAYTAGPSSYVQGEKFSFKATATNTGATTVNVSGLGAKNIYKQSATGPIALIGGEIQNGAIVEIEYDGTEFQAVSPLAASGLAAWASVNSSGTVLAGNNVASVTHGGTGSYTVNFTNALPDTNYGYQLTLNAIGQPNAAAASVNTLTVGSIGIFPYTVGSTGPVAVDSAFSIFIYR